MKKTRGATVTRFNTVVYFCCKGLNWYDILNKSKLQDKNSKRLKFQDFNMCPNISHMDTDADARGIAIAFLHWNAVALKSKFPPLFYLISLLNIQLPPRRGNLPLLGPFLLSIIFSLKRVNCIEFFQWKCQVLVSKVSTKYSDKILCTIYTYRVLYN